MDLSKLFPLRVDEEHAGWRLDRFLADSFPEVSRARWARLIELGTFRTNHSKVTSATRLSSGEEVSCTQPENLKDAFEKEKIGSSTVAYEGEIPAIVFEDEDLLVINKPAGLAVHPGAGLKIEHTVVGWLISENKIEGSSEELLNWDEELLEAQRPGIVHRLDRGTSGLLVIAKNPSSHKNLSEQFAERSAGRLYWALIKGSLQELKTKRPAKVDEFAQLSPAPLALSCRADGLFSLATFLERDPAHRTRFRVSKGEGRYALTHFRQVSESGDLALVELKLATGRTHQIRVHLAFLGFPVFGDENYGASPSRRLWLHAHTLNFVHPKKKTPCSFHASWTEAESFWIQSQGIHLKTVFNDKGAGP